MDLAAPLFAKLAELGIPAETVSHPPVYTVEEARAHRVRADGLHLKNLFLRNKKGAMWLVSLREDRAVDLKALGGRIGAGHVSFGSAERLAANLGVAPGSVTPFAALHDRTGSVTVVLDAAAVDAPLVWAHPLVNDRTTGVSGADLVRFLEATGHPPVVLGFE